MSNILRLELTPCGGSFYPPWEPQWKALHHNAHGGMKGGGGTED